MNTLSTLVPTTASPIPTDSHEPCAEYLLVCQAQSVELNHGSWRFTLESADGEAVLEAGDEEVGDLNRLTLLATVRGLESIEGASRVTLLSTNRYLIRSLSDSLPRWRENNFVWEHFGRRIDVQHADLCAPRRPGSVDPPRGSVFGVVAFGQQRRTEFTESSRFRDGGRSGSFAYRPRPRRCAGSITTNRSTHSIARSSRSWFQRPTASLVDGHRPVVRIQHGSAPILRRRPAIVLNQTCRSTVLDDVEHAQNCIPSFPTAKSELPPMQTQVSLSSIGRLINGTHENPSSLLGPHPIDYRGQSAIAVRSFLPDAQAAWIVDEASGTRRPMRRLHPGGFFEAICESPSPGPIAPLDASRGSGDDRGTSIASRNRPTASNASKYRIQITNQDGTMIDMPEPYSAPSILTDFDRYLLGEGRHHQLYERLGAQLRTVDGTKGVNFAVWAPNARSVQIVGDFNAWDGRSHVARGSDSGIWELFVPTAEAGDRYKFRLLDCNGHWIDKSDPVGFAAELPPLTASIVADLTKHTWGDGEWMESRRNWNPMHAPMNVYEVHLGSWQKGRRTDPRMVGLS